MITLGDVFRRFVGDYVSMHGASLLPSHARAIADILACRTEALGGHLWRCDQCSAEVYSYHSCKTGAAPSAILIKQSAGSLHARPKSCPVPTST